MMVRKVARKKKTRKKKAGPSANGPEPVAVLEPAELRRVVEQARIIGDAAKQLSMLRCCWRVLWGEIQEKYELPDGATIDGETGRVYEAKG